MSTAAAQPRGAGQEPPGRRPSGRSRIVRSARSAGFAVALCALLLVGDAAALSGRVGRMDVELPAGSGETWVLVGLDSRAELPPGASSADFGTADEVPGSRADVVLVLHRSGDHTTALSVPRDVVSSGGDVPGRLALSWLDGPRSTVDALCALGIPAGHLVSIDLAGFAAVVDAAGGLDVDVAAPVRDPSAGLLLPKAGHPHVDGRTALAMVRSRHPEHLVDGQWLPAPEDPDGRATAAGSVLSALAGSVRSSWWRPWRLQSVAEAASGALTVDRGTSIAELATLLSAVPDVEVLPVGDPVGGTLARFPTAATGEALSAAGLSCAG